MDKIFPKVVDNNFKGYKIASITFLIITLISIIRSLIHIFSADGGASSIAGMNLTYGAKEIIFVFALWGSAQLVQAVIQLVIYLKYKSLIPFMYLILILEYALRILIGPMKGIEFSHVPPGAIANYGVIVVALIMLVLSFNNSKDKLNKENN
jgi:hypothetical protein